MPKAEITRRVGEMLELVRLSDRAKAKPRQLSGGQQQRVAFARALVFAPDLLLMDEPLGALDKNLREQMKFELKRIHAQLGVTVLYVTHDQEEALTMSDRVALMNDGVIAQLGTARDLYERPATRFVAEFIGESNVIEATAERDGVRLTSGLPDSGARARGPRCGQPGAALDPPREARARQAAEGRVGVDGTIVESVYMGTVTPGFNRWDQGQPQVCRSRIERTPARMPVSSQFDGWRAGSRSAETPSVMLKMLLSQISLDSRRAAKPTPRTRTRITRVPRWKRKRLMAWSLNG